MIVTIPKQGDFSECGNWKGITLSPGALKIFCKVLFKRMASVLDGHLRDEQAGFKRGRGCNDQIFIIRLLLH